MAEENSRTMNLDLNLGPLDDSTDGSELRSGPYPNVAINLEDWLDGPVPRLREVVRHGSQRWRSLRRQLPIPPETQNLALELIDGDTQQVGEGSIAGEEQPAEMVKMCESGNGYAGRKAVGSKDDNERSKSNGEEGSFFDCNVCMDLAKDPVVTCCGHLFCWPCLYQWLYCHSDANECPVCKGLVTIMNITPIYGRVDNKPELNVDCSLQIPHRPQARRVESWRQTNQRIDFTMPMEEMIRRLGSAYDLTQGLSQSQSQSQSRYTPQESPERNNVLLNRFPPRGMRRERIPTALPDDLVDLTERSPPNHEVRGYRWLSSMLLHRTNSLRTATLSSLEAALNADGNPAAERLVQSYFQSNPVERGQELPPPHEDRDSVSSIIEAMRSQSPIIYNTYEIDSTVTLSASSSRRRRGGPRTPDAGGAEDLRLPRRRRLN